MNFRSISECSYANPYSCGAIIKVRQYLEHDYVIRLLKGLNEQYAIVKSQIMMLDHFLSVKKAFSLVIQQER